MASAVRLCYDSCSHAQSFNLKCTRCGKIVHADYGLSFGYMKPGLRLTKREADRLREIETSNLLRKGKLVLVLDLDQTLLHSVMVQDLTPEEQYLQDQVQASNHKSLFITQFQTEYIIKFRPFVDKFLEEASTMFDMYVYTSSSKAYDKEVVKYLDPESRHFSSRIISREDSTTMAQKDLDLVLGQERVVVILDDEEDMWPMHSANLIRAKKYSYFTAGTYGSASSNRPKSLAERKIDEDNKRGVLTAYLQILKTIHRRFFESKPYLATRDVREVMKMVQTQI